MRVKFLWTYLQDDFESSSPTQRACFYTGCRRSCLNCSMALWPQLINRIEWRNIFMAIHALTRFISVWHHGTTRLPTIAHSRWLGITLRWSTNGSDRLESVSVTLTADHYWAGKLTSCGNYWYGNWQYEYKLYRHRYTDKYTDEYTRLCIWRTWYYDSPKKRGM